MWRHGRGGRDMVKACSKFGGRRASVRDTRLKDVMVRKEATDTKSRKKKKNKKEPLLVFTFF